MKKYLLLFLCTLTVGLSSCKKEVIAPALQNRTVLVNIPPANWDLKADGTGYYTIIDVPENTSNFNQIGHIVVALSFGSSVFEGLPEVYQNNTYRFDSRPKQVTLYIERVGNTPAVKPTVTVTAKVTLIDAEQIF